MSIPELTNSNIVRAPPAVVQPEDPSAAKVTDVAVSALESLPHETCVRIARKLDLEDLMHLSSSCTLWRGLAMDDRIWGAIAQEIGCPLVKGRSIRSQVRQFILDLLEVTERTYLAVDGKININQIRHLHQGVIARDIYILWLKLGLALNQNANQADIFGGDVNNEEDIIAKASKFNIWFVAHQNELGALTDLHLADFTFSHIPAQLCSLTNLRTLNLSRNLVRQFPSELSTLPELRYLDLKHNPFRANPVQVLTFPPKLIFDDKFVEALSQELNLQIGNQLGYPCNAQDLLNHLKGNYNHKVKFAGRVAPDDILPLLDTCWLTFDKIQRLLDWRKARDTLSVWQYLAQILNPNASFKDTFGVDEDHFNTAETYINMATQFQQWLDIHQDELTLLPSLDFTSLGGRQEIPKELSNPLFLGKIVRERNAIITVNLRPAIGSLLDSPIEDSVLFCHYLEDAVWSYKNGVPAHIRQLLKNPTYNQLRTIRDWLRERNTMDVWQELGQKLGVDVDLAGNFSDWFNTHCEALSQITELDLSRFRLISLPKEIGEMTGLKTLKLGISTTHLLKKQLEEHNFQIKGNVCVRLNIRPFWQ